MFTTESGGRGGFGEEVHVPATAAARLQSGEKRTRFAEGRRTRRPRNLLLPEEFGYRKKGDLLARIARAGGSAAAEGEGGGGGGGAERGGRFLQGLLSPRWRTPSSLSVRCAALWRPARQDPGTAGCATTHGLAGYRLPSRPVWGVIFKEPPAAGPLPSGFQRSCGPGGLGPLPRRGSFDLVRRAPPGSWTTCAIPHLFLNEIQSDVLVPGGEPFRWGLDRLNPAHYGQLTGERAHWWPTRSTQRWVEHLYGGRPAPTDTFPGTVVCINTSGRMLRPLVRGGAAGMELVALDRFANPGYFTSTGFFWGRVAVLSINFSNAPATDLGAGFLVVTLRSGSGATTGPSPPPFRGGVRASAGPATQVANVPSFNCIGIGPTVGGRLGRFAGSGDLDGGGQ